MRPGTPKTTIQIWEHRRGGISEIGTQRPGSGADEVSRNCGEARAEVTIYYLSLRADWRPKGGETCYLHCTTTDSGSLSPGLGHQN